MQFSEDPINLIVASLRHPDPMVRKSSARYLVGRIPVESFSLVRSQFEAETHPEVVKWLARAIGKTGRPSALKSLQSKRNEVSDGMARDWIDASVALASQPESKGLLGLLKSSDPSAREEGAILSWGVTHIPPEVIHQLERLIDDDPAKNRRWAELSLYHHGCLQDAHRVSDNLDDPDYRLREWTAHVVAPLAAPSAKPKLLDMYDDDESPRVREWVARALANYEDDDVRHFLYSRWLTEVDPFVREAIIVGLIAGPRFADDGGFLVDALQVETSAVTVGEIIRNIVAQRSLVGDHEIMSAVEQAIQNHAGVLDIPRLYGRDLANSAHETDTIAVTQLQRSPAARLLMKAYRPISATHVPRIAIVIALIEEFDFVFEECRAVGIDLRAEPDPFTGRIRYLARHSFPSGFIADLEFAVIGGMGPIAGAVEATRIVLSSKPDIVAVLGIAGSLHNDVKLCDVVLAAFADNYLEGAKASPAGDDEFTLDLAGEPFRSDPLLLNYGQHLDKLRPEAYRAAVAQREKLIRALDKKHLDKLEKKGLIGDGLCVTGPVASGPIVGAATKFTAWLRQRNRAYRAIEMESGGVAAGVYGSSGLSTTRLIIVRGVSDFSDERKKDLDNLAGGQFRRVATTYAFYILLGLLDASRNLMVKTDGSS